ncbi:MAG: hypothetical protein ACOYOJ_19040 [Alsobacter sp.]
MTQDIAKGIPRDGTQDDGQPVSRHGTHAARMQACVLYGQGATLARIAAETGLNKRGIYTALENDAKARGEPPPRRVKAPPRANPIGRETLVTRMWAAADRQVGEIEARFALPADPDAAERDARTLATLARVVRELVQAGRATGAASGAAARRSRSPQEADDDAPPRDLDALRDELARRLARLRAERDAAGAAGDLQPE